MSEFDISRKPIKPSEDKNKYQFLGFSQNPFPINPSVKVNSTDVRENGSIFLTELRSREIKNFKELMINNPNMINLVMDYAAYRGRGNGKTAFLNFQRRIINNDMGSTISNGREVLFAIYVVPGGEKKERKFWQISKLIYDAIVDQDIILVAFSRLRALSGLINPEILSEVNIENLRYTIADDEWLGEKLKSMNGPSLVELNSDVNKRMKEVGININLSNIKLFSNTYENFKEQILVNKTDYYWRTNAAGIVFNTLTRLFVEAQFSHAIILFDEAEKIITSQNSYERREFADSLRYYFIDGNCENANKSFFKILMTIHPYSQELLLPHWKAAGLERFAELGGDQAESNTLFFHPIENVDYAIPLAQEYLRKSRINGDSDGLSPFTRKALIKAFTRSDNIPGKYLKLLYLSIEKAISEDWKTIDEDSVESVFKASLRMEVDLFKDLDELTGTITDLK